MIMEDGAIGVNPTFGINDFNQPKILTETQTFANDIMMLLFGKPGFYPAIPTLGIDISRYLYMFDEDIDTESIKSELVRQCSQLGDAIDSDSFDIMVTEYEERTMLIVIFPDVSDDRNALALGITTGTNGDILYKFQEIMNKENFK